MKSILPLEGFSVKEKQVLSRIYREGPLLRNELQKTCKIKIANFYNIIERLSSNGIIRILETDATNSKGRPSEQLVFNHSYLFCICIVLTKSNYCFAITDLKGTTIEAENHQFNYSLLKFEQFLHDLELFFAIQSSKEQYHGKIKYSGFVSGVPLEKGLFRDTGNSSWKDIPILSILTQTLGCKVLYNSISQAAVFGIYFNGFRKEYDSLIFYNLSKGLGIGIILNKRLLDIDSQQRTLIEHMVVNLEGRPCFCGERGCVITSVGTEQIIQNTKAQLLLGVPSSLRLKLDTLSFEDISKAAQDGDELAVIAMKEAAMIMAVAIRNIDFLFHIPIVVIGGRLCHDNKVFFSFLEERIQQKDSSIRLFMEKEYLSKTMVGITNEIVEYLLEV